MKIVIAVALCIGWMTGCASNPSNMYGTKVMPVSIIDVCQTQHDGQTQEGEPVTVCDQIYNSPPHVLPPVDTNLTASANADFYGSIKYVNGHYFIQDRNGQNYQMVTGAKQPMADLTQMKGNVAGHVNDTVYRVHGKMTLESDPATIQVSQMQPAIQLTPSAQASLKAYSSTRAPASLIQTDDEN